MVRNIITAVAVTLSLLLGACATRPPQKVTFEKTVEEGKDGVPAKKVAVDLVCARGELVYDDSFTSNKSEHDRYACQYTNEAGVKQLGKPRELAAGSVGGGQTFFGMNLGFGGGPGGGAQFPYGSRVACPQVMVGNGMARCQ